MSDNDLLRLLADTNGGVLVTLKRDGRPQMSNVNHHYDPDTRVLRVSLTDDRAKTRNLRRDPRASYHVTTADRWAWTVAEGTAELTPSRRSGTMRRSRSSSTSSAPCRASTLTGTTTAGPWSRTGAWC